MKKISLLIASLAVTCLSSVQAALVISNGDIVADHYVYQLTYADMANNTKFSADVFTNNQTSVREEAPVRYVLPTINNLYRTTSSFSYKFDFSTTEYRPVSLSLGENMYAFASSDPSVIITSSYSIDNGVNWITLRSITSYISPGVYTNASSGGTTTIDLSSQPVSVLYRVNFASVTSGFGWSSVAQWNREDSGYPHFQADFTVVPEPSTSMLLLGALLLVALEIRKRHAGGKVIAAK